MSDFSYLLHLYLTIPYQHWLVLLENSQGIQVNRFWVGRWLVGLKKHWGRC